MKKQKQISTEEISQMQEDLKDFTFPDDLEFINNHETDQERIAHLKSIVLCQNATIKTLEAKVNTLQEVNGVFMSIFQRPTL